MDTLQALELLALRNTLKPDYEAFYRRVCRWYSKTFHTPLMDVYELPVEHVFSTYFEDRFENMEKQDLRREWIRLSKTPQEQAQDRLSKDAEEAEVADLADMVALEEPTEPLDKEAAHKALEQATGSYAKLQGALGASTEASMPKALPEDVELTFVDEEELEELLDGDGVG